MTDHDSPDDARIRRGLERMAFATWLLLDTEAEAFSKEEWEIGDSRYRPGRRR